LLKSDASAKSSPARAEGPVDLPIQQEHALPEPKGATQEGGQFPVAQVDWNMQDLVWNNLPWDWDLVDGLLVDGMGEGTTGERDQVQNNKGA